VGVENWAKYVKWISVVLMVVGIFKMFSSIIGAIIVGAMGKIEVEGPDYEDEFEIPTGALVVEKLLEVGTGLLIFLQGKFALQACLLKTEALAW